MVRAAQPRTLPDMADAQERGGGSCTSSVACAGAKKVTMVWTWDRHTQNYVSAALGLARK